MEFKRINLIWLLLFLMCLVFKQSGTSQIQKVKKLLPLTTQRMYHPDSIIKSGRWGTAVNIRETKSFDKFTTKRMEPGIVWTNGMFTAPGNAPTEMIYYHDGSKRYLSGYVSVLDCIDYCGGMGDCGFIIEGDGKVLWESGVVKHHDIPVSFSIPLRGIHELRLITNSGGDNIAEDWGCWMELKVSKKAGKTGADKVVKSDNILINGSFEEGVPVGSFKTFSKGDKIPGWTVTKATIDIKGTFLKAQDGKKSIDLNGTPGFGGIQQRFFTKKGKKYLLSFYLAGNPDGGPKIKKLLVSFGDQTRELEFDVSGKTTKNMGWEYHEFVFKAKQHATILKFESNHKSGPTNWGPVIDNVKLVRYKRSKHHKVSQDDNTSISLFGLKYGFLAGAGYYFVSDNNIYPYTGYDKSQFVLTLNKQPIGYHLGMFSQVRVWRIFIRPEINLNYIYSKVKVHDLYDSFPDTISSESHLFLDLPVLLGYKAGALRLMAGPIWHLFLFNQSSLAKNINISKEFKKFTIGFQAGMGINIKNIGIDLRYECNCRNLGDGLEYSGKRIYFAETPYRIIATLSYSLN